MYVAVVKLLRRRPVKDVSIADMQERGCNNSRSHPLFIHIGVPEPEVPRA
jgi:hypothetical protein